MHANGYCKRRTVKTTNFLDHAFMAVLMKLELALKDIATRKKKLHFVPVVQTIVTGIVLQLHVKT